MGHGLEHRQVGAANVAGCCTEGVVGRSRTFCFSGLNKERCSSGLCRCAGTAFLATGSAGTFSISRGGLQRLHPYPPPPTISPPPCNPPPPVVACLCSRLTPVTPSSPHDILTGMQQTK